MITEPLWVARHRITISVGILNYAIETWNIAEVDTIRAQLDFVKVLQAVISVDDWYREE